MTLATDPGGAARREGGIDPLRPLVLDFDRALIGCDLTLEMLVTYLKADPRQIFQVLGWIVRDRGNVLNHLAERAPMNVATLPINQQLADFARKEAAAGRSVFLVSSISSALIEPIKARLPFVEGIIAAPAADAQICAVRDIGEELARRFPQGFDYAGSTSADLGIWRRAHAAVLVNASTSVTQRAAALVPVAASIPGPSAFSGLVESLRLHQWIKNLLVFAPIVLGGQLSELPSLLSTIVAFLAMGLVASSTYLLNDVFDVADDRRHWSKRERPIAGGRLPASTAVAWAFVGLVAGLSAAAAVSWLALGVLLAYVALTISYSLGLKRLPLIDGLVLAVQYTLRLALGVVAAEVPPSPWLFVFSMFLFTSLSLAKRLTELGRLSTASGTKIAGRGYRAEDAPLVLAFGVAAGIGAVVIIILYIIDDAFRQTFYGRTLWLWGFPPLIFLLICRIWLVTVRGQMDDDPVRFMLVDRVSQCVLAVLVACFAIAWLG